MNFKKGIRSFLPAFGVKGWLVAIMGMAFYYFWQGPIHAGVNFYYSYFEGVFGWTNTQISSAVTFGLMAGVLGVFLWGPLTKKLGAKKTSVISLVCGAATIMIFALAPSLITMYISVVAFAFCAVGYSQITVATFAANWFPRTRGMYMGMATMGITATSATFTAITAALVPSKGLTFTLTLFACIMVVIAILVGIFAKNTPEEAGAWPDNDKSVSREELLAEAKAAEEYKKRSPWTLSAVLKCRYTWTVGIGWGICMMVATGFISQLVPTLIAYGHNPNLGIILLSSMWPCGVIGNWLGGVADNRFGTRTASIICAVVEVFACLGIVAFGSNVVIATVCTGLLMAAMSAFSNVTVSMVTNVFGRQDFENAWPVVSVPFKIVESFGPLAISLVATAVSFSVSYIVMIGCLVLAIVLMLSTTTKQIGSQIHS